MLRVFRCENDLAITLDLQHCGCRSSLQQCCPTRHLAAWIKPRHMSMSRPCPLRAWMAPHHLLVCMGDMLEVCDVFVNCHRTENGYNINFFVTNKISSMMFSVILSLKYKLDTQFSMNRNSPQNFLCDEGGLHSDKSHS